MKSFLFACLLVSTSIFADSFKLEIKIDGYDEYKVDGLKANGTQTVGDVKLLIEADIEGEKVSQTINMPGVTEKYSAQLIALDKKTIRRLGEDLEIGPVDLKSKVKMKNGEIQRILIKGSELKKVIEKELEADGMQFVDQMDIDTNEMSVELFTEISDYECKRSNKYLRCALKANITVVISD